MVSACPRLPLIAPPLEPPFSDPGPGAGPGAGTGAPPSSQPPQACRNRMTLPTPAALRKVLRVSDIFVLLCLDGIAWMNVGVCGVVREELQAGARSRAQHTT